MLVPGLQQRRGSGGSGDEIRTPTSLAKFWVTYLSFGCFSNTQPEKQKMSKNYEKRLHFQAKSTSAQTNQKALAFSQKASTSTSEQNMIKCLGRIAQLFSRQFIYHTQSERVLVILLRHTGPPRRVVKATKKHLFYGPLCNLSNRPFPSCHKPMFQGEAQCKEIDIKTIFHLHAKETHFHMKGFCTQPRFQGEGS